MIFNSIEESQIALMQNYNPHLYVTAIPQNDLCCIQWTRFQLLFQYDEVGKYPSDPNAHVRILSGFIHMV